MDDYRALIELVATKGKLSKEDKLYCLGFLDAKKNMLNDAEYNIILDLINKRE